MAAAGNSSPPREDTAVVALRRLLRDAGHDEQVRVDALLALSKRTLFGATWQGGRAGVRTLTNSSGETAMPLFTGPELLRKAAQRFGWMNPDGTLNQREMLARDAMRHAVARGVHFVVMDIGTDHTVEFAREEIEPILALHPSNPPAGDPSDMMRSAVRKSTRPPPVGGARSFEVRLPAAPKLPTESTAAHAQAQLKQSMTSPLPVGSPIDIDMPFAELKPQAVTAPATPAPVRMPAPEATTLIEPIPAPAAAAFKPYKGNTIAGPGDFAPAFETSAFATAGATPATEESGPDMRAAAMEVAATLSNLAKSSKDAGAAQAAAEVAKMLMEGSADDGKPAQDESTTRAGRKIAAMFFGGGTEAAEADAESTEEEAAVEPGIQPLEDALLDAMAQTLRKYPEVESAAELAPDDEGNVVGIRIDPSYTARANEIFNAVRTLATGKGCFVTLTALDTAEKMKAARANGRVFFPFRKGAAKKSI